MRIKDKKDEIKIKIRRFYESSNRRYYKKD